MADLEGLPENLRNVIADAIGEIDNLSEQMEAGTITLSAWQDQMEAILARYFQAAGMVGAETDEIDILEPSIASQVDVQTAFLDNFAGDIAAAGWQAAYNSRAEMYGSAIKQAYWLGDTFRQAGAAVPLPAMPAEGTQCLSHCKCSWRIETLSGDGNYDAYWVRNVQDSCQTCLEREAQWSPVRIRGGILQ